MNYTYFNFIKILKLKFSFNHPTHLKKYSEIVEQIERRIFFQIGVVLTNKIEIECSFLLVFGNFIHLYPGVEKMGKILSVLMYGIYFCTKYWKFVSMSQLTSVVITEKNVVLLLDSWSIQHFVGIQRHSVLLSLYFPITIQFQ